MKNNRILIIALAVIVLSTAAVFAANPGSQEDPVISLSYINNTLMPEIRTYVDQKVASASLGQGDNLQHSAGSYQIVNLNAGETVICDASCEIILRQGSARILSTELGGLSDVTGGHDLGNGSDVPANHLLIVPRGDGRGVTMQTNGILMIRGSYIKQ